MKCSYSFSLPAYWWSFLIFTLLYSCQETPKPLAPPNILWIVSEDNSPWLGCYGDSLATSPNLDALAAEGIRFTHAYSNAPVCAPSRSALITGAYPISLGTEHMRSTYKIPQDIQFYPKYLKEKGYYTSNNHKKDYNTVDRPEVWNKSDKTATYRDAPKGQAFFHIFNYMTTHESRLHWDSIARYHDPARVKLAPFHPNTPEMRNDYAVYYDRIKKLDTQVGELLRQLEEDGLAENTIVFYYSDHGGAVGGTKRFVNQSGLRVPLVVRVPEPYRHLTDFAPGSVIERPVSFVDLTATLMQLAGIDQPKQMVGQSVLRATEAATPSYAFGYGGRMDERPNLVRSVTDGEYRLTLNYMSHLPYGRYLTTLWKASGMQSWAAAYEAGTLNEVQSAFFEPRAFRELYHIKTDPFCTQNLSGQSQVQAVEQRLQSVLNNWQIQQRDAGMIPEGMLEALDQQGIIYDYAQSADYPIAEVIAMAQKAGDRQVSDLPLFLEALDHDHQVISYWAAMGCLFLTEQLSPTQVGRIRSALNQVPSTSGIVLSEILWKLGDRAVVIDYLQKVLQDPNLMVRVQALNVITTFDRPAITQLAAQIRPLVPEHPKQKPYDGRLARTLMQQIK